MHEASIAAGILETLEKHPELAGKTVRRVHIQVGKLVAVVPDNLQFMWGAATQDTPLAGVPLEIEEVPARAVCERCAGAFEIEMPFFRCPTCGSGDVRVETGRELRILDVDVE